MGNEIKQCCKCKIEKEIKDFYRSECYSNGFRSICKDCYNEQGKLYRQKNREKQNERKRQYIQKHTKEQREYQRKYRRTNSKLRLSNNMSRNIRYSLKVGKNGNHWEVFVDYSIQDLIKHIEKQFKEGMTWDNYGKWHIDHEIPIAVFNFTKPEHIDFKRCWELKNLQPLWAEENIKKRDKLKTHFQPNLEI